MKLADQLIVDSFIYHIPTLYESATSDRIGRAVAQYKKDRSGKLAKNLDNTLQVIHGIMKDVRSKARGLDNKTQRKLDDAINKLGSTMSALGIKPHSRPFDVTL